MEYNNAYQNILLSLENNYLLSIGINSKVNIYRNE